MITYRLEIRRAGSDAWQVFQGLRGVAPVGRAALESLASEINANAARHRNRIGRYNRRTRGQRLDLPRGMALCARVQLDPPKSPRA